MSMNLILNKHLVDSENLTYGHNKLKLTSSHFLEGRLTNGDYIHLKVFKRPYKEDIYKVKFLYYQSKTKKWFKFKDDDVNYNPEIINKEFMLDLLRIMLDFFQMVGARTNTFLTKQL